LVSILCSPRLRFRLPISIERSLPSVCRALFRQHRRKPDYDNTGNLVSTGLPLQIATSFPLAIFAAHCKPMIGKKRR
jgi:hypothetical protein